MKNIYFNDELTELYKNNGTVNAQTQSLRAPYDDPDFASFFADKLIIVKDAGQLQITVRYNASIFDSIEEKYGVRFDGTEEQLFSFELERIPFEASENAYSVGTLDYSASDSLLMYTYYKLVFDGVEFLGEEESDWLRLKITLNGVEGAKPYYILVYEQTDEYSLLGDYELSRKEKPDV
jgi:hypothetical protein